VAPAGGWRSGRWRGQSAVAVHWSWPYMVLQTSVFDEVFTYGIDATWQTSFAHLGRTAGNYGGWCGWGGSAQAQRRCQQALRLLWLN
jgi:hypothetical protein